MKLFYIFIVFSSLSFITPEDSQEKFFPKFNLKSGFYNIDSIVLEISIDDPEALIYYTLDGSTPNINSTIYKFPIVLKNKSLEPNVYSQITKVTPDDDYVPPEKIKKANIIRAMAKLSGYK